MYEEVIMYAKSSIDENANKPVAFFSESWVDIHYQNNGNNSNGKGSPKKPEGLENAGMYTTLNIEKLLKDAQRESASTSRDTSARGR